MSNKTFPTFQHFMEFNISTFPTFHGVPSVQTLKHLAQSIYLSTTSKISSLVVVVVTRPLGGWGHGGRPWSLRSRATHRGLDSRSYRQRVAKERAAQRVRSCIVQNEMRGVLERVSTSTARTLDSSNSRERKI